MKRSALIAVILCGCATTPSYDPARVQRTRHDDGRTLVRLQPVLLKKLWDSDATLELTAASDAAVVGVTIRRSGHDARVWKDCRSVTFSVGEDLLHASEDDQVAYESELEPREGTIESITVAVPRGPLRTMAEADAPTIAVCKTKLMLDENHRRYLDAFLEEPQSGITATGRTRTSHPGRQ